MQQVQRSLKERGYYQGAVDGIMGARTRAAIAAFQRDANMEPTGRLDAATLTQLLQ
jgi:localization factor PodJL